MLALAIPLAGVLAAAPQAAPPPPPPTPPVAVQRPAPPIYNPEADARAQIATALKSAKEDEIRVLLNFGANDDQASKAFATARRSAALRFLSSEYKVVNVDVGRLDKNVEVARAYGVTPKADDLPALAVLDADGKVLARSSGAAFRSGADPATHDPEKIAAFLKTHQAPPPPDAEPTFAATVARAKNEGKAVFVWFSAPW